MLEQTVIVAVAVLGLIGTAVSALLSVAWVNRRHAGKLLASQASKEDAEALSVVVEAATARLVVSLERQADREREARVRDSEMYLAWLGAVTRVAQLEGQRPRVVVVPNGGTVIEQEEPG